MSKETIGKIVSSVVGLALVGSAVYLLAIGHEHGDVLLSAGLAALGAIGTLALPRLKEPKGESIDDRS